MKPLIFTLIYFAIVSRYFGGCNCTAILTIANDAHPCKDESLCMGVNEIRNLSSVSRVHINFHPGRHILNKSEYILFENVSEVRMVGEDGGAEVLCTSTSGLIISNASHVFLSNLSFFSCGGYNEEGYSGIGFASIFLDHNFNILLQNLLVSASSAVGVVIRDSYGAVQIHDSLITGSQVANMICMWMQSNASLTGFEFLANNVSITNGGSVFVNPTSVKSGGMNIRISGASVSGNIMLDRAFFYNNSGHRGGNLDIEVSFCHTIGSDINISLSRSSIQYGRAYSDGGGVSLTGSYCDGLLYSKLNLLIFDTDIVANQAMGSGGGMYMSTYHNTVRMQNVRFKANRLLSQPFMSDNLMRGGGLYYQVIPNNKQSSLVISECMFANNSAYYGAGMFIELGQSYTRELCSSSSAAILMNASHFVANTGQKGGALVLIHNALTWSCCSLHQLSLISCIFEKNMASSQASGLFISLPGCNSAEITMDNTSFAQNSVNASSIGNVHYGLPSTLYLKSVTNISLSRCSFYQNYGSGMGAVDSKVTVLGFINFTNNTAMVGSGLNLISSYLQVETFQELVFEHNHASKVGGAIYTSIDYSLSNHSFFTSNNIQPTFHFINNSAQLGGSVFYERSLSNFTRSYWMGYRNDFSLTATDPYQICICEGYNSTTYDCKTKVLSYSMVVGSGKQLYLITTDNYGRPTPGYVTSMINSSGRQNEVIFSRSTCSRMLLLTGTAQKHLVLIPKDYQLFSALLSKPLEIHLNPLPCPAGFQVSESGDMCQCHPFINASTMLQCDFSDYSIVRSSSAWIDIANLTIFNSCPFSYCRAGRVVLSESDSTSVCSPGRIGILCGKCSSNLSLKLGNDECGDCSNSYIALVLTFCALGIFLVILVTLLNLTLAEGTINGVIFYAAFLHLNKLSFFPNYSNRNLFPIIISWLNLDFGFNVCFYSGLTSYTKVWLQFVFPLYLYAIETIVVVSSYKSSKLARVTGAEQRLKVLSTIFLLGYMKLLRAVISIFPYADIQLPAGKKLVWLYDGSIEYFSAEHTPLFVVAILFLAVIAVPYTVYLVAVQLILKLPCHICEVQKHGIIDAHVGPFKKKSRFWLGFLLFNYTVLVCLHSFTGGNKSINLTGLVAACSVLLLLKIICGGIYKSKVLEFLESLFLFNLCILSAITLQTSTNPGDVNNHQISAYLLVSLAFAFILVTFLYHAYLICTGKDKCKFKLPWNNSYRPLHEQSHLDSFETEYENASTHFSDNQAASDLMDELVPSSWIPTKFSVPVFREDPDLLQDSHALVSSVSAGSSPAKTSFSDVRKVRSSVLTVDKFEEEANLTSNSNSDRSQRLSVDISGNRTYIIEDGEEQKKRESVESQTKDCTNASVEDKKYVSRGPDECFEEKLDSPCQSLPRQTKDTKRSRKASETSLSSSIRKVKRLRKPRRGTMCHKCLPKLCLEGKIERFKVDQHGKVYTIAFHDVTINIPPSAIAEKHIVSMDIEVGIALSGPFVFPQNLRPISPILWICIRNKATLCKSAEITLPHILKLNFLDSKKMGLQFLKANHRAPRLLPEGSKKFVFRSIGDSDATSFTSHQGKLKTNHFCFLCIAAPDTRAVCLNASYCLTRVEPIHWNPCQKQDIYFIVSYSIKTCLNVIGDQIASSGQKIIQSQTFFHLESPTNKAPKLAIKLKERRPSGWLLVLGGSKQILAASIDFWKLHDQGNDIEDMTQREMYPPRFKLEISGQEATNSDIAEVFFVGCQEDLDTEIMLNLNAKECPHTNSLQKTGSSPLPEFRRSFHSHPSTPSLQESEVPSGITTEEWSYLKCEPDSAKLLDFITRVETKWREIGLKLKIEPHILDKLRCDYANDGVRILCVKVLQEWEKNIQPPYTWATLIAVLNSEFVGEHATAQAISDAILKEQFTY